MSLYNEEARVSLGSLLSFGRAAINICLEFKDGRPILTVTPSVTDRLLRRPATAIVSSGLVP